ncbi:antitoxin, Phd family protein [Geothermobacter hydrogeniphilus]|uniref:Antitoxin n=1 Tax=Geothermobacter hydrogeniphilus TaxID=1969733 RepID=A0A2K2HCN5_9BACT|nr:type II toxin-antitoxin system Phd/YefM family antitoxin [Geothermobacter hydrogeniphilus]PNU21050.1 antitoxin, Phd family protein [Geothermobacter hydrogeniphilus]
MKLSDQIKPISYLKSHTAEIFRNLEKQGSPLIITQNGEAKAVVQNIHSYERDQERLALLKILALGNRQIEEGRVQAAEDVVARLRSKGLER